MSNAAGKIADYFGEAADAETPVIVSAFSRHEGKWLTRPGDEPATIDMIHEMKRRRVEAVAVRCQGRIADFTIGEIIAHAERPMFGGRII